MDYVTGYCDKLSARAGDTVSFMLSAEPAVEAELQLVRLVHGDENPIGPGFIEREIDAAVNGRASLTKQHTQLGNYIEVADPDGRLPGAESFSIYAWIWPTTPDKGRQGIISRWCEPDDRGFSFGLNDSGCLSLRIGDGSKAVEVCDDTPLVPRLWYFVAAVRDAAASRITLYRQPVVNPWNSNLNTAFVRDTGGSSSGACDVQPALPDGPVILGGYDTGDLVGGLYNGKIDRAGVLNRALDAAAVDALAASARPPAGSIAAAWDPTLGYTDEGIGDTLVDTGPHGLNGHGVNRPVRGMTGYNWSGRSDNFRLAPGEYGGMHLHDDAITDCRWQPTVTWTIPDDFPSGVYALRARAGDLEDHVVVFIRPRTPQAKIAMLMPTASYLAYANEHFVLLDAPVVEAVTAHPLNLFDWDFLLAGHTEWGKSTYDTWSDGGGVCYSSYRRPVMNLRPRHRMASTGVPWQFPADMSIVGFLEIGGFDYDVITDEDLHREGVDCLRPYNVVLNGTHSEYYSKEMMDATEQYVADGGRVMYLGANGYYWVVSFRDAEPWCMEVRKLDSGSRAWQAQPGEHYMATNGERGGLWRHRGRSPQKMTGVGFTSEGMDHCVPYTRMPDSHDPACAWIFEGVDKDLFGDYGLALGGAGGLEVDRYELALGTPPDTYLLATTEPFTDNYPHVAEEIMFNIPGTGGTQDYQVRGDMTYVRGGNGGAVFSSGSIAWGQALPINDGDNDCARITANVLRRFAADGPVD